MPLPSWRQNGWGATRDLTVDTTLTDPVLAEVQDLLIAPPVGPSGAPRIWIFSAACQILPAPPAPGAFFAVHWTVREGTGQVVPESALFTTGQDPIYPGAPADRNGPFFLHGSEVRLGARVLNAPFSFVPSPGTYRIRITGWLAPWVPHSHTEVAL